MPRKIKAPRYPIAFIIAAEGAKTEPDYFAALGNYDFIEIIDTNDNSSPKNLLKAMQSELQKGRYNGKYEAWIICDRDDWPIEQLKEVINWSDKKNHYKFALSSPKFELWLLLHFVDGKTAIQLLKQSNFKVLGRTSKSSKGFDKDKIGPKEIKKAIARARKLRKPKHGTSCLKECINNHGKQGKCYCTDIYRLIEKILKV